MPRIHGLVIAGAIASLMGLLDVESAQAGRRHRGCGNSYDNGCAPNACAASTPTPAPEPITVTKTIMVPETVYETMTVPVSVCKPVTRTKTITVYRMVPQTRE